MPQCPICKSEAEEIDLGLFDGAGFSCKRHGEFRVVGSVFKETRARTRQQWENALVLAERRAALGTRPLITTYEPGSLSYEPFGLVHQWGNPGDTPFTFLAFNINPEGVAGVIPGAPAK